MSNASGSTAATLPARLERRTALVCFVDIVRATTIFEIIHDENRIVQFFDGFYDLCIDHLEGAGGEVVKCMGDAVLAVFDANAVTEALGAIDALREAFTGYASGFGVPEAGLRPQLRGAAHIGEVVIGGFSKKGLRDCTGSVVSRAINTNARGIAIGESVYRKLPSGDRSPWKKQGGDVIYVRS